MKLEIPDQRTEDWATPQAEPAPQPTPPPMLAPKPSYAPFLLALGITMLFWGVASSPVMSAGGVVLLVWSLWMWIRDIANGWRNEHAE
jgi:hypothetical protein